MSSSGIADAVRRKQLCYGYAIFGNFCLVRSIIGILVLSNGNYNTLYIQNIAFIISEMYFITEKNKQMFYVFWGWGVCV